MNLKKLLFHFVILILLTCSLNQNFTVEILFASIRLRVGIWKAYISSRIGDISSSISCAFICSNLLIDLLFILKKLQQLRYVPTVEQLND